MDEVMSDIYAREIMRAIGRLEGKVEDILMHQKAYNGRLEKLDGKIDDHEKEVQADIAIHRKECDVKASAFDTRLKKAEGTLAKFLGVISVVAFVVSITFNAIVSWLKANFGG